VSVKTTWARRAFIESEPPPDWYWEVRSTVATPVLIEIPSSFVPAGIEVARPALASAAFGPASSAFIAAVATNGVASRERVCRTSCSPLRSHTSSETEVGTLPVGSVAAVVPVCPPAGPRETAFSAPQPAATKPRVPPTRARPASTSSFFIVAS